MTQTRKNRNTKNKTRKQRVFKKKDFLSGDGFLVSVWGPAIWHYLHIMSFNYPINPTPEDKKHYRDFILNLQNVLPCKYCRMNLKKNLKSHPLTMKEMESRETFSRYVYELHETINKMLHKKSNLTYCDVRERYEHFRSRCTIDKENIKEEERKDDKKDDKKDEKEELNNDKKEEGKGKKEKGCTEPLYGKKSKCIINIVPQDNKSASIKIDKKCIKKRDHD